MPRWVWCLCFISAAQAQGGYLTYPTGVLPTGVAAADFNGDGRPDVAIANAGSGSVTILLNSGAGGFTAPAPLSLGQADFSPTTLIAADLNRDGKTDLVVNLYPNSEGAALAVWLGNGDGTFQEPTAVSGCGGAAAQVADLNGDGIPDVAVTCLVGGSFIPVGAAVNILLGNGNGTFRAGPFYGLGFTPWAVLAVGDFNHDGKPDLALAVGGALTVLLNDGKANFTPVVSSNEPWNFAPGIAAGDFNGDGLLDLAVTGQSFGNPANGTVTVLLGKGDGTFQGSANLTTVSFGQIAAMDLNGDGHMDLVTAASTLVFFPGRGDGTFENGYPFGGSGNSNYLALADFAGSGVMGFAGGNDLYAAGGVPTTGDAVILARAIWPTLTFANASAAGYGLGPLAAGSIVAAYGSNLAAQTAQATGTGSLPVLLGGASVSITDSAGTSFSAPLYYVSPAQVNYLIPAGAASGLATVSITANGHVTATGPMDIVPVAPALFTMNSSNLAAANVIRVSQNGTQTYETIYQVDQNGAITALPIDLGSATDTIYVALYGTGIRSLQSLGAVSALGGAAVTYAGPQGNYEGLDQVNVQLPNGLAGPAPYTMNLQVIVNGQPSNPVTLLVM